MGRTVKYVLRVELLDKIRISFTTDKGQVTHFVAQYESKIAGAWTPIIRYDTHHGFAHRDELFPDKAPEKTDLGMADWNKAFTFARNDLIKNWQTYKSRYIRRMKNP